MSVDYVVSSITIQKLKQDAKRLKKELGISHTRALEQTAKRVGFHNWHQVTQFHKRLLPAETALKSGVILGMDAKEGSDFAGEGWIADPWLALVISSSFRQKLLNSPDPDDELDRMPSETMTDAEFEEWFNDCLGDNVYFRLDPMFFQPQTIDDIVRFHSKQSFWPAWYIWFEGKIFEFENDYKDPLVLSFDKN